MTRLLAAVGVLVAMLGAAPLWADVGDPQVRTDHPWYPGELACSTFDRLFAAQAALYERVTGNTPVSLQVTATVETLKALAGAAGGEMEFSLPLPSATVQRLACDSSVMRVLFEADSLPVDVGRSRRLVDGGLRKALAVRDKHCQWPGCERPASWCDGHHLVHWVDGGETNLENTVLLCKRHHRMVHEGGWKLIKVEGKIVSIAPTVTFGLPRGPD